MRYLTLAALFVVFSGAAAEATLSKVKPAQIQVDPKKPEGRKIAEYKKALGDLTTWAKKLDDEDFYDKQWTFKNKETGEEKPFKSFDKVDKRMFMLATAQRLSSHLGALNEDWEKELKKAAEGPSDGKDDSIATQAEIKQFIADLANLRKVQAAKWEEMAQAMFKDYPDKFTKEEKEFYLKQIRTLKEKLEGK
jgi:hypothetical protein